MKYFVFFNETVTLIFQSRNGAYKIRWGEKIECVAIILDCEEERSKREGIKDVSRLFTFSVLINSV